MGASTKLHGRVFINCQNIRERTCQTTHPHTEMVGRGASVRTAARTLLQALNAERGRSGWQGGRPYPVKSREKAVKLTSCVRRSAGASEIKNLKVWKRE